jgi:hypothetical protein
MTEIARARVQLRDAANRLEFACIALGRECLAIEWVPEGCEQLRQKATELQRQISQVDRNSSVT